MPHKTDKNILKQYFRSGSRPTQKQFHELIDNCYNEAFTSFVSGYHLLVDIEKDKTYTLFKREAGRTVLVPFFERINTPHQRVYHYAIPVSNLGRGFVLDKIVLEMTLPQKASYTVKDGTKKVRISQMVKVEFINIYNGSEEIYSTSPGAKAIDPVYKIQIGETAEYWKGIGIDIGIRYDIKSDIAVSDQLDITAAKGQMLEHAFGSAGCLFIPNETAMR